MNKVNKGGWRYIFGVLMALAALILAAFPVSAAWSPISNQAESGTGDTPQSAVDQSGDSIIPDQLTTTPSLSFTLTAKQLKDVDGDKEISPGDTLKYTATIRNTGSVIASSVRFYDTPAHNTTLIVKSVTKTQGTVINGNSSGDKKVYVSIGNIAANTTVTITFNVTINSSTLATKISNQAYITGSNIAKTLSDDPATSQNQDATVVSVKQLTSQAVGVPGVSGWGMGGMVVLFGGMMAVLIIRKRTFDKKVSNC